MSGKNGEVRYIHVLRKDVLWNGEKQVQVLYSDITDRKRAEERFLASLREKDILLEVNGEKITADKPMPDFLQNLSVGETIKLQILRSGEKIEVKMTLAEK